MPEPFRRILVGFTGDADGVSAVALAGRFAEDHGAHLTVVAATAPPAYLLSSPHGAVEWQALPAALAECLRGTVRALPARIGVTHLLVEGGLAEALEGELGRESFDLLVLAPAAARGRGVRRLLRRTRVPLRVAGAGSLPVRQDERGP